MSSAPLMGIGNSLRDLNRFEAADRAFRASRDLEDSPQVACNHASLLIGLEAYDEAFALAERRFELQGADRVGGRRGGGTDQCIAAAGADRTGPGGWPAVPALGGAPHGAGHGPGPAGGTGGGAFTGGCAAAGPGLAEEPPRGAGQDRPARPRGRRARSRAAGEPPVPAGGPWGRPLPPARRAGWTGGLPAGGGSVEPDDPATVAPRIGLTWASGSGASDGFTSREYRKRTLPPAALVRLVEGLVAQGCEPVLLQQGEDRQMADPVGHLFGGEIDAEGDFLATARVLAGTDLVISVDTAMAHLVGAMGRPGWILLPFSADPRWLRQRQDSPWYSSLRLFRQPSPGAWEAVVLDVLRALDSPLSLTT